MKASKTEGFHRHLLKDGVKVVILYRFKCFLALINQYDKS